MLYILIALAVIIIGFLIIVAMQPDEFRITRSITVNARPDEVFPQANNLHNMEAWSPWEKMDPDMDRRYEGPPAGVGAKYSWSGNKQIGEGSMTIVESRPNELVGIDLAFIRPFQCTNKVEFTFDPKGSQTTVTWSMSGHNKFINKAVCLFMNMDKMCGGQFEQGLQAMKQIVEGTSQPASSGGPEPLIGSPEAAL